jgi:hypothetical protein
MAKKHVAFAPANKWRINGDRPHFVRKMTFSCRKWGLSPFILKASLSSPSERNRARSAFLTVFSPYSLRQARESDRVGQASMSERSELRSRREERNLSGVKNLLGARPSPNTLIQQSRFWGCFRIDTTAVVIIIKKQPALFLQKGC